MGVEIFTAVSVGMIFIALILIIGLILSIINYFKEGKEIKKIENKIKKRNLNFNEVLTQKYNLEQKYLQQISISITAVLDKRKKPIRFSG